MAHWRPGISEDKQLPATRKITVGLGYNPSIRIYTLREVSVMLRHSVWWLREQIKAGRLSAVYFGGRYFVHHLEVARWMGLVPRGSDPLLKARPPARRKK